MVQPQLNKLKVSDILMQLVTLVLSWIHFTNKFVGTNKNYVGKVPIMLYFAFSTTSRQNAVVMAWQVLESSLTTSRFLVRLDLQQEASLLAFQYQGQEQHQPLSLWLTMVLFIYTFWSFFSFSTAKLQMFTGGSPQHIHNLSL